MTLQDEPVSIEFGQGVEQKTDPKMVVAGQLLSLTDAVFTKGKRLQKRNGYTALTNRTFNPADGTTGTLVAPKFVKTFKNEEVCADSGSLYAYSSSLGAWVNKGVYECIASTQLNTTSSGNDQTLQSCVLLGNFLLLTWMQNDRTSGGQAAFAAVMDITSGTKVLSDTVMGNVGTGYASPRACLLGSTAAAIFYIDASDHLVCRILSTAGNSVSFAAAVTIATDPAVTISTACPYDVENTSTGAVVLYSRAGDTAIKTIDTAAAVTHSASIGGTPTAKAPSLCVHSAGNIWVYWQESPAGVQTIYYGIFSSTLSAVLAKTLVYASASGAGVVYTFVANADSSTQQTVIYEYFHPTDSSHRISSKILTSIGGTSAAKISQILHAIYSKPFTVSGQRYMLMAALPNTSGMTGKTFLVNIDRSPVKSGTFTGIAVSKALVGSTPSDLNAGGILFPGFLGRIVSPSSTQYSTHSGYVASTETNENSTGASIDTFLVRASAFITFDWNHQDAFQAQEVGGQLILNGGIVSQYDGNIVSELNFNNEANVNTGFTTGAGGHIADGSYIYYVVMQWVDNQGNIHQSAPTFPLQWAISGGGGTASVTVKVYVPTFTLKDPNLNGTIIVGLYRTASGGTQAYQVNYLNLAADPSGATVTGTLVDKVSDTTLLDGLPLYLNGNVLINDPPPPSMIMTQHNNRVWALDSTNPLNIWYSKTNQMGVGLSFSGDLLVEMDPRGNDVGGIAELDDKLMVIKKQPAIFALYGDGANDTGSGSTLSAGQFVQSDVGILYSKSVFQMPQGLMFRSPKGWYLLDRSLSVSYIGAKVEDFNSQDVTSVIRVKDKTEIRILTSSGSALIFDYFFNQWGTFTNHAGYSADIGPSGLYTYVRTDGSIYQENTTSFLDGSTAYRVKARLAWLKTGVIQGFQRVKRVLLLGDYSVGSGHGVQISAGYDFVESLETPVAYSFPSTSGVFQYRERLRRQKCDALTLYIEEVTTGASGEYIDISDLGLEVAIKKGLNKLGQTATVK